MQLATEIEKSVGCCLAGQALVRHHKAHFSRVELQLSVCVCVSYYALLDFAFGLIQLMLQVPDDLFVFGVALLDHFPLPL